MNSNEVIDKHCAWQILLYVLSCNDNFTMNIFKILTTNFRDIIKNRERERKRESEIERKKERKRNRNLNSM